MQSAAFQDLQRGSRNGVIDESEKNLRANKINQALLQINDHLPEGSPDSDTADEPHPKTSLALFPGLTGLGLLVGIVLLMVFMPCPSGAQFIVFRIALALGAAGLAAVIPGFFEFGYKKVVSAGGALAVFAFVYLTNPAALAGEDRCNEPFDVTIFLENAEGATVLTNKGSLNLRLDNDKRIENIDAEGSASFKRIPPEFKGDTLDIELLAPGWQFANRKSNTKLLLEGTSSVLVIQRDSALYCCISGMVRDPDNKPLPGATLDILGVLDTSDAQGRFELVIPVAKQAESYTLTATHPRYLLWELTVYPATRTEVKILMSMDNPILETAKKLLRVH